MSILKKLKNLTNVYGRLDELEEHTYQNTRDIQWHKSFINELFDYLDQQITVKVVDERKTLSIGYQTIGASGFDFKAFLDEPVTLAPGKRILVQTGIKLEIPPGYELQVRPRSGLAFNYGVSVLNTPGTIDSDYRGPIGVILVNHGDKPFVINPDDRIAQGVFTRVVRPLLVSSTELSDTDRGEGGFGSTGVK